jgi:hypothetical protein
MFCVGVKVVIVIVREKQELLDEYGMEVVKGGWKLHGSCVRSSYSTRNVAEMITPR